MQTPEPSLDKSQQQGASEEEAALDPSRQQTAPASTPDATSDQQTQPRIPAARAEKPAQEQPVSYSEEDILKGLVYPPPPTFYEQIPLPAAHPAERQAPPTRYTPEAARAAISYAPSTTSPLATAPDATRARQTASIRQPVKRSRTWIWGVVAIMGLALVASSSLCGWAAYNIFSNVYQTVQGIENTVNGYYSELQARNYAQAYNYLALTGAQQTLTQAQFTQQATQQDSQYGPVLSYTPGPPAWSIKPSSQATTNITQGTITVQVGRKQKQYTVTLTLHKEGNIWKITSYSQL